MRDFDGNRIFVFGNGFLKLEVSSFLFVNYLGPIWMHG